LVVTLQIDNLMIGIVQNGSNQVIEAGISAHDTVMGFVASIRINDGSFL